MVTQLPLDNNYLKLAFAGRVPLSGGFYLGGPADVPGDLDWASLDRLCPVSSPRDAWADLVTEAQAPSVRKALSEGLHPADPKSNWLLDLGLMLIDGLDLPAQEDPSQMGHLYVLEAQGPFQYVMYGQSRHVQERLRTHWRDASRHGFGLVNVWVSPPMRDLRTAERIALDLGRSLHAAQHNGERFYDMPWTKALTIARVAAETRILAEANPPKPKPSRAEVRALAKQCRRQSAAIAAQEASHQPA